MVYIWLVHKKMWYLSIEYVWTLWIRIVFVCIYVNKFEHWFYVSTEARNSSF